jgi:hypothetical protein
MHLVHNSVFEFADELGFNQVMGMPRDFLHYSVCLATIKAIIYSISTILLADAYFTEHGNQKTLVNCQTMHHMLLWLAKRLASIEADESCLTITPEYTQGVWPWDVKFHWSQYDLSHPGAALRDEGSYWRGASKDQRCHRSSCAGLSTSHVEDPCEKIIDGLLVFL